LTHYTIISSLSDYEPVLMSLSVNVNQLGYIISIYEPCKRFWWFNLAMA